MTLLQPGEQRINIVQGEFAVSAEPHAVVTTLLGSCVAVCMNDPLLRIGGMNHFLLPGDVSTDGETSSSRHGVHLMELLINGLFKLGASRERLQAKLFGGARTVMGLGDIGKKNIEFANNFLKRESIEILPGSTGGLQGRRLQFWPTTGRIRQSLIAKVQDPVPTSLVPKPKSGASGDLELF